MKKILITLILAAAAVPAFAQHWRHGHHMHRVHPVYSGGNWVVPAIIGGAIVYGATRPAQAETVIVQQQPVIVQQQSEHCTPWKEIQTSDGKTYRERTCTQ